MEPYEKLEIETIEFDTEDVLTASKGDIDLPPVQG